MKIYFTTLYICLVAIIFIPFYTYGQCSENQPISNSPQIPPNNPTMYAGQTITAACDGFLSSFTYQLNTNPATVTVEIRQGTTCASTLLHSQSHTQAIGTNTINFSSPPAVTNGQSYLILMVSTTQSQYDLKVGSVYAGGNLMWTAVAGGCQSLGDWDMEFSYSIVDVLPVELVNFKSNVNNRGIELNWLTASEINNLGFEIQHSVTGKDWKTIDFVAGRGNSNDAIEYQYQDKNPFAGVNYYRLKQIDFDDSFEYSDVVSAKFDNGLGNIQIFPNPSKDFINLQIENLSGQSMEIKALDNLGRTVYESASIEGATNWSKEISFDDNGIYIITVQIGREVYHKRVIINK